MTHDEPTTIPQSSAEPHVISARRQSDVETVGHTHCFQDMYLRTKFKIVPQVEKKKDKRKTCQFDSFVSTIEK